MAGRVVEHIAEYALGTAMVAALAVKNLYLKASDARAKVSKALNPEQKDCTRYFPNSGEDLGAVYVDEDPRPHLFRFDSDSPRTGSFEDLGMVRSSGRIYFSARQLNPDLAGSAFPFSARGGTRIFFDLE